MYAFFISSEHKQKTAKLAAEGKKKEKKKGPSTWTAYTAVIGIYSAGEGRFFPPFIKLFFFRPWLSFCVKKKRNTV